MILVILNLYFTYSKAYNAVLIFVCFSMFAYLNLDLGSFLGHLQSSIGSSRGFLPYTWLYPKTKVEPLLFAHRTDTC